MPSETPADRLRDVLGARAAPGRALDSVTFNAVLTAYVSGNQQLFAAKVKRLRPGYRPAFDAWIAERPLKNPAAPSDPSQMVQYRLRRKLPGAALSAKADAAFARGELAA